MEKRPNFDFGAGEREKLPVSNEKKFFAQPNKPFTHSV